MGGGCLYFDAKMIRHAWHYSRSGSGGREGAGRASTRSECHQIRSHEVEGQKCSTCRPSSRRPPIRALQQRASRELRGAGWRMRGQRGPPKLCAWHGEGRQNGKVLTPPPLPPLPMSHVSTAQREAHPSALMQASTCWDVRGGSGGRSVWNSHVLSPRRAAC